MCATLKLTFTRVIHYLKAKKKIEALNMSLTMKLVEWFKSLIKTRTTDMTRKYNKKYFTKGTKNNVPTSETNKV